MSIPGEIAREWLDNPEDELFRSILTDWYEERGDPRAALLHVIPAVLATPRRQNLRDDCKVRSHWPELKPLRNPLRPDERSRNANLRGVNSLGRLFCNAALRWYYYEFFRGKSDVVHMQPRNVMPRLIFEELCCCRVLAYKSDITQRFNTSSWPYFSLRARFGMYSWIIRDITASANSVWCKDLGTGPMKMQAKHCRANGYASLYSHFLDMHDTFARIAPWNEMQLVADAERDRRHLEWLIRNKT